MDMEFFFWQKEVLASRVGGGDTPTTSTLANF